MMTNKTLLSAAKKHVQSFFSSDYHLSETRITKGTIVGALQQFSILELAPKNRKSAWLYFTLGSSLACVNEHVRHEFFMMAPSPSRTHVQTLTMLAYYHATPELRLELGSVIEIGQGWIKGSVCDHLLISLPYLQGPKLEWLKLEDACVRFLWALPITAKEAVFAKLHGVEALESKFDDPPLDYLNPLRSSRVR